MAKDVIIIASGETERRSIPHLIAHLESEGLSSVDVRIPPRNRALNLEMAEKILKAAWYEWKGKGSEPDKFVILVDTDGKAPDEVLRPFRENLPARLSGISVALQFAFAQWHLEAWYFGDITNSDSTLGVRPEWILRSRTRSRARSIISNNCWGTGSIPRWFPKKSLPSSMLRRSPSAVRASGAFFRQ